MRNFQIDLHTYTKRKNEEKKIYCVKRNVFLPESLDKKAQRGATESTKKKTIIEYNFMFTI